MMIEGKCKLNQSINQSIKVTPAPFCDALRRGGIEKVAVCRGAVLSAPPHIRILHSVADVWSDKQRLSTYLEQPTLKIRLDFFFFLGFCDRYFKLSFMVRTPICPITVESFREIPPAGSLKVLFDPHLLNYTQPLASWCNYPK